MTRLDREVEELDDLVKRKLKINAGLEAVLRNPAIAKMRKRFEGAMKKQVDDLLSSDLFSDIDAAIGEVQKAESVHSESDDLEIEDAVVKNIKPLSKDNEFGEAFADFLILIFNLGGQDFLNKNNIPATFNLTNKSIVESVRSSARPRITGVDDTTAKKVSEQISSLRQAGKSNAEIADSIRQSIPETYANRAEAIVRTETSQMVGESEHTTANKNGASHKEWVTVSDGEVCDLCEGNETAGVIGVDQPFPSGDLFEPAHPNCRCLVEYVFTPFMGTVWHGQ